MSFQAHITYRGPLENKVKGMGAAVKSAMVEAMQYWHQKDLPEHFKTFGSVAARYPGQYTARGKSYMIEKAKKYHHAEMCKYSGELERNVTRGIVITGSAKLVRGRLPGSQKANFRRTPNSPNVAEELRAVNVAETLEMAKLIDKKVSNFLNSNDGEQTVVI